MRVTIGVLLLLYKCLTFAPNAATEPVSSELSTKELEATKQKLQATETRFKALETSQQELMSRLANSEAQIEKIKMQNQDRPKVAFSASLGLNDFFGPVNADSTLVYKNVFMNVGNAYQQTTGIFTAPVRGVYYFSFFYHCSTSRETWLHLYRNGKKEAIAGQHKTEHGMAANGSNGLTLLLEKGDQVYIVLRKNSWIWDRENVTVFNGFLINAM